MSGVEKYDQHQPYQDVSPLSSDADSDDEPSEVRNHDHELLQEDEERENLLLQGSKRASPKGFFNRASRNNEGDGLKKQEARRKRRRHGGTDEDGELMYEMEEGGPHSDISSQASMSSSELDKLNLAHRKPSKVYRYRDQEGSL